MKMSVPFPFNYRLLCRIAISLSVAIPVSYILWRCRRLKKKEEEDRLAYLESWNIALFFPDYYPEGPHSPLQKLLTCLKSAKVKVRVCVMTLSDKRILDVLVQKYHEGVGIQVYTSDYSAKGLHLDPGIKVKSKYTEYSTELHHKFAIVDDMIVCTGSANWNAQSFDHQNENILITTNPKVVSKYIKEFDRLWNEPPPDPTNRT